MTVPFPTIPTLTFVPSYSANKKPRNKAYGCSLYEKMSHPCAFLLPFSRTRYGARIPTMEEKKEHNYSKDRYFAVGARGIVYPYEMGDDVFFWGLVFGVLLFVSAVFVCVYAPEGLIPWFCWSFAVLELLIILGLSIHHGIWRNNLRRSDAFTILYDISTKEYVLYLHTAKEQRIPARAVVGLKSSYNKLFNPLLNIFNLNERHLGNITFTYRDAEGEEKRLLVRDIDKPEIALLRVGMVKEQFLGGETPDIEVKDDSFIQVVEEGKKEQ